MLSSYPLRTKFNNCFIIFWKYFKLSLNACFVSKKTQVAMTEQQEIVNFILINCKLCSETLISQSDYEKIFLKQLSDYKVSQYDEMSHNVVYLFSIYDEMTHNVVYFQPRI